MSDSDRSMDTRQTYFKSPVDFAKRMVPTEELIEMVQQHPCLWDRHCPEYRDRMAKDKAWNDVYSHFQTDYDSLKKIQKLQIGTIITKKWYNVRDSYRKSLKPGSRNAKPYLYAERLKFLEHVFSKSDYNTRRVKGEPIYLEERLSNDDDENENEEQETWLDEVFIDVDEENVNAPSTSTPAKRPKLEYPRPKETHEADDSIVAVLANLIQKEEDEDRAFFKSITPAVKSLSERSKFMFRIQVMKLINSLKARDKLSNLKRDNVDSDSE